MRKRIFAAPTHTSLIMRQTRNYFLGQLIIMDFSYLYRPTPKFWFQNLGTITNNKLRTNRYFSRCFAARIDTTLCLVSCTLLRRKLTPKVVLNLLKTTLINAHLSVENLALPTLRLSLILHPPPPNWMFAFY